MTCPTAEKGRAPAAQNNTGCADAPPVLISRVFISSLLFSYRRFLAIFFLLFFFLGIYFALLKIMLISLGVLNMATFGSRSATLLSRQPHSARQLLRTCQSPPNPRGGFGLTLGSDG
ncbi:TPA: hypothetical protein ACT1UU_004493 [Klebsiella oxytoca]|nr:MULTISPECIES: hypothetical protein [Klebsiella]MBG2600903.1 hypothetical protein [Klebsiella oxytoca]MDT8626930.1 hypothetical protein [Klebsiella grimontii]PLL60892.1 hypothetical protein CWN04_01640 [Klebsiella michiganensis]